jgi:hypothetical protein
MLSTEAEQKTESLANLMKAKRENEPRFVVMLGAGASLGSGVKNTDTIMRELLDAYGPDIKAHTTAGRFDKLWQRTSDANRDMLLRPYLNVTPSTGYAKLAALMQAGFLDVILTFNFDNLVEQALRAANLDFRAVIRGETDEQAMSRLLESPEPRCKLLKLHGSLRSSKYFLFSIDELLQYSEPTETLVRRLTANDIIVCGYAFNDTCVTNAFSREGGTVACVNPSGAPRGLEPFLEKRRSEDWVIEADFDGFFTELHRLLLGPRTVVTADRPTLNPFKFLQSYEETDYDSLPRRESETSKFFTWLSQAALPHLVVVAGPEKSGKTSLVKASLLPKLDPRFLGAYVRCKLDWKQSLPLDIDNLLSLQSGEDSLAGVLRRIGTTPPDRHVVLFLDEFDRVIADYNWRTRAGREALGTFLRQELFPGCNDHLTLVLVVTDEESLGGWLFQAALEATSGRARIVECLAFEGQEVREIIQTLAARGGLQFDCRIIDEMVQRYEEKRTSLTPERFTLAHIQAVCHILASKRRVEYETYKAFDTNLTALHQAINVTDIMSFVEDFSWPDTVWLRNMIKVPLKESKELIAEFIKKHYVELMPQRDAPPAPRRTPVQQAG